MRRMLGVCLISLLMAACGNSNQEKGELSAGHGSDLALTEEEAYQLREFSSDAGRRLGLVLYRQDKSVIDKGTQHPKDMAAAKLCLLEGEGKLEKVIAYKSCCDRVGTEIRDLPKLGKKCWWLEPVSCLESKMGVNFSLSITFEDQDVAEYLNSAHIK